MTLVNREITLIWWEKCLKDEAKLNAWLQKLYLTEYDGYHANIETAKLYNATGLANSVLYKTAEDEFRHAKILGGILERRGVEIPAAGDMHSVYWDTMDAVITDLKSACAVYHMGESLAAERFWLLREHPETPGDIKWFLEQALPDETYHAEAFKRVAGPAAIAAVQAQHEKAVRATLNAKLKEDSYD